MHGDPAEEHAITLWTSRPCPCASRRAHVSCDEIPDTRTASPKSKSDRHTRARAQSTERSNVKHHFNF
eukprot:scaffold55515_cov26-Tisochrysis_lutea.AAC.8